MTAGRELIVRSAALFLASMAVGLSAQQPPPLFQSKIEVTSVDVGVVDRNGKPITDLSPGDFTVRIDGEPRRVVSAQWVAASPDPGSAAPAAAPSVPDGYTANTGTSAGRLIVLAIDEPNIRFGGANAVGRAASTFIDRLSSSDRIAIVGLGPGLEVLPFTADFARAKLTLGRMNGRQQWAPSTLHSISVSEAMGIFRTDPRMLDRVVARECRAFLPPTSTAYMVCATEVETEADQLAEELQEQAVDTTRGLADLFRSLRNLNAPKTVVVISEGFVTDNATVVANELGTLAAAARASVYVLQLDQQFFDIGSSRLPGSPSDDRQTRALGFEELAGAARGDIFTVTGNGAPLFDRIQAEISGYYLLGIESEARDRDGRSHGIRIDVPRSGAQVRARRQLLNPVAETATRSPQQAVSAGLASPLPLSALPVRVATFALQGPERDKVQLLIHGEVGADFSAPEMVSVGYEILDSAGLSVETERSTARLAPVMSGVPSALQFAAGASLKPGNYTLKFVAAEGDRAGSVEHPIHAALTEVTGIRLSELMVGGPPAVRELLQPTIGYTVNFGSLHGYVEAYGPLADAVTVKYEIATDQNGPTILAADAPGLLAGDDRMIFSLVMPIPQLPAGKYVLRARISSAGKLVRTLARGFEVAPPAVFMASATGTGSPVVETDVFLPIDERLFSRPFVSAEALTPGVLAPFLERVAQGSRPAFEAGIAAIASGDFVKAQTDLKTAVQPDIDSSPALAYLAVVFAASGHDAEAAAAWQTALADGADLPQVYEWLSYALIRTRSLVEARTILEEATTKWPADDRFIGPLAMAYATLGKGREAIRLLQRYLEAKPDDLEGFRLGVEWLYHLHSSGGVAYTRADDVKLAHMWADRYGAGPQQVLVRQWMDFLDRERP